MDQKILTIFSFQSMNGIYVNRAPIPTQQPKALQVGDCLGIGALENTDVDYYLFDVLKNVIKYEVNKIVANVGSITFGSKTWG